MKRTYKRRVVNSRQYSLLTLPGSDLFQFEIVNKMGSNIERAVNKKTGKNLFGMAHFIEHLGFRATQDYTSEELTQTLINEGLYNAITNHDMINYFFRTISNRAELAINLVCNYALNELRRIPADEFETEKRIVYNEAKQYADDDQTMFHFNTPAAMCGYNSVEDNVIGIPSTIDKFTIEDAIFIKDVLLSHGVNSFNITYDPLKLSEEQVINIVETQLDRFCVNGQGSYHDIKILHDEMLGYPRIGTFLVENESEQVMTSIMIDSVPDGAGVHTSSVANDYIAMYAETSLNNIIREKHGLTYGLYFTNKLVASKPYLLFSCDVSKGTENKLMELFVDSIVKTVDEYSPDKHEKYISTRTLKRAMAMVDQKQYLKLHDTSVWYPELAAQYEDILAYDVDAAFKEMDAVSGSYTLVQNYMNNIKNLVVSEHYSKATNLK